MLIREGRIKIQQNVRFVFCLLLAMLAQLLMLHKGIRDGIERCGHQHLMRKHTNLFIYVS